MLRKILAIIGVALTLAGTAAAQVVPSVSASDTVWTVELTDGSTLYGRVVAVEDERLTIVTEAGVEVAVPRTGIRSMSPLRGMIRDGEVWIADSNTTRLFFGPTGRMMRRGDGYIAAFELFLPFISYSLTDRFTIAGGTPPLPGVIGRLFYVAPKLGLYEGPGSAIALGVLAFFSTYDDFESAGIGFVVGTWGSEDDAFTAGIGWPFVTGDMANLPVGMVGIETRTSRRTKFVSENYLIAVDEFDGSAIANVVLSGGARFIGDRLSADLGLGVFVNGDGPTCCLPLVNFVYHLRGRR